MSPETCPNCGADLPRRARACPECGADERTGWSEHAAVDRLGLPPDPEAFDHEDWVRSELGSAAVGGRRRTAGERRRRFWWWVAVAVLGAFLAGWVWW